MLDLIEQGRRIWEADTPAASQPEEPRLALEQQEREQSGGNPPLPPPIRHASATDKARGCGKSATSAISASPLADIETIIHALTVQVGHQLGDDVIHAMRQAMGPMDRASRADLAARIDDALASAETDQQGRETVLALLGVGKPQEANNNATTRPGWLEWTADQCPLAQADKAHIRSGLSFVHPRMQQRLAERYVQTWREAAAQEPSPPKRQNAGRRAANLFITRLLADASNQP